MLSTVHLKCPYCSELLVQNTYRDRNGNILPYEGKYSCDGHCCIYIEDDVIIEYATYCISEENPKIVYYISKYKYSLNGIKPGEIVIQRRLENESFMKTIMSIKDAPETVEIIGDDIKAGKLCDRLCKMLVFS